MKTYQNTALITENTAYGGAYVPFPYNLRKETGRGRAKAYATFDGTPYDVSIVNMRIKTRMKASAISLAS